ncbi:MAG: 5-oxoprolinase subunit PxpB [Desulfobacteraceae bacterium]|nr:MAG: 5-oxoprolinase subunit PxpB [Desulfobacteraceae bacterium]
MSGESVYPRPIFRIVGDGGLQVEYGEGIAEEVNRKVCSVYQMAKKNLPEGVIELIPAYRSLLIVYDPCRTDPVKLEAIFMDMGQALSEDPRLPFKTVEIPVCYGDEFGPDLGFVAGHNGLDADEVIALHAAPEYPIYMIGFSPGFPYLGGLPAKLHTPRLKTPRTTVSEGSVGIANDQTGIYTVTGPGGWQLIGRTPLKLFRPESPEPFLFQAGDRIRFKPISKTEFLHLKEQRP